MSSLISECCTSLLPVGGTFLVVNDKLMQYSFRLKVSDSEIVQLRTGFSNIYDNKIRWVALDLLIHENYL